MKQLPPQIRDTNPDETAVVSFYSGTRPRGEALAPPMIPHELSADARGVRGSRDLQS